MSELLHPTLRALNLLLGKELESDKIKEGFWKQLELNVKVCEEFINCNKSTFDEVISREFSSALRKAEYQDDVLGRFTVRSLSLLDLLSKTLSSQRNVVQPPHLLGAKDMGLVCTVIQGIVSLGVCPLLGVGVVPPLQTRLKTETLAFLNEPPSLSLSPEDIVERLYLVGMVLVRLVTGGDEMSAVVNSHFLLDLLAVLMKLTHDPQVVQLVQKMLNNRQIDCSTVSTTSPKDWLNEVLLKTNSQHLVQNLILLQSPKSVDQGKGKHLVPAPKWLRSSSGRFLTHILLKPNGLLAVIEGFLASTVQGEFPEWKRYATLASIVATCPAKMDRTLYLSQISSQVVNIIQSSPSRPVLVAGHTILTRCVDLYSQQAVEPLLHPLITPLRILAGEVCLEGSCLKEQDITKCLGTLKQFLGLTLSDSSVVRFLTPYLLVLFHLWVSASATITHIKGELREVVEGLLHFCDKSESISFFAHLAGLRRKERCTTFFKAIRKDHVVDMGDGGGICVHFGNPLVKVGKGTYERCVELAVELLSTHGKDLSICGDVFLLYFQHLCTLLCLSKDASFVESHIPSNEGYTPSNEDHTPPANPSLLLAEESSLSLTADLFCLYATAELCENHTVTILNQVHLDQLLLCVKDILSAHSKWLSTTTSQVVLSEHSRLNEPFGSHLTLTMATGLLSALMSAYGAIHSSHTSILQSMLPTLKSFGDTHPIDELSTLCSNLHVCIATLGAVWGSGTHGNKPDGPPTRTPGSTHSTPTRTPGSTHSPPTRTLKSTHSPPNSPPEQTYDKKLTAAVAKLSDPSVPMRAEGIHHLVGLVQSGDPQSTQHFDLLLKLFQQQLKDSDSFVYLAAINGIVAMVTLSPERAIPVVVNEFISTISCHQEAPSNRAKEEVLMKVGEALIKAAHVCGESLPVYKDHFMKACMAGVKSKSPLVRASSLSNLGELCNLLNYSIPSILQEVLSAVERTMTVEDDVIVKRAACLVVKMLFSGLDRNIIEVLQGSLKDFYRLLKRVVVMETDDIVVSHAQSALQVLDRIMRELLFPQQTLTKKISIVSPN